MYVGVRKLKLGALSKYWGTIVLGLTRNESLRTIMLVRFFRETSSPSGVDR